MIIKWTVKPLNTPTVIRNCSHCGCKSEFECSGDFRINAQQKNLDVWLIYKCIKCGRTWNMEIFSRINPDNLERNMYEAFLKNDTEIARRYAFDTPTFASNRAQVSYDNVSYVIDGKELTMDMLTAEPVILQISAPYSLQLRLDRILNEKTTIPRADLKLLFKQGAFQLNGPGNKKGIEGTKLKNGCKIYFDSTKIKECIGNSDEKIS